VHILSFTAFSFACTGLLHSRSATAGALSQRLERGALRPVRSSTSFQNLFLRALIHRLTYLHVLLSVCREVMLRGEVAAPFRKARKYLWIAAGGSASIGTGTALLQLFAKLAGAPRPPPVNTSLQNISINAIALTILCMLPHKRRNPMTCSAGS
jgi:hypothetical protein